jgi:deoxyadenosine/deoxycytidine kinase
LYPVRSKVENIGFTENATHCEGISAYKSVFDSSLEKHFNFQHITELKEDERFLKYFSKKHKLLFRLKLLSSTEGRKQLLNELRTRVLK